MNFVCEPATRFVGRLRCGALPWQTVPVEVGVERRTGSVVALRPAARPPRAGADRYFTRSLSVLGVLCEELVAFTQGGASAEPQVPELRKAS